MENLKESESHDPTKAVREEGKIECSQPPAEERTLKEDEQGRQFYEFQITKKDEVIKNLELKVTTITEKAKQLMQKYADLKNKNTDLETQLLEKESEAKETRLKMEQLKQLNSCTTQNQATGEEGRQFYESEITKKEEVIKTLESKVSGITEKLKELFQKYADLKNKNTQLEKSMEGMAVDRERELQEKESEIKEIQLKMERVEQLNSDLKSELQTLSVRYAELESDKSESEKLEVLTKQYEQLQSEYQQCQQDHHSALQEKDRLYEEFQTSSRQEIESMKDQFEELRAQYSKLEQELSEVSDTKARVEAQEEEGRQFYESEITKKEEVIKTLESKVSGITEKLKELMQKYADLKNKNTQLEKSMEGMAVDRDKGFQQKESEIVKIQLKMERVEQLNSDLKSELQTLSDRYSENQRHLQDLKQQYHDFQQKHEHCDELYHQIQILLREKDDITTSYERKLLIVQKDSQENLDKLTNQLHSLQYAYELLEKKYSDDTENKQILDNYKKKAQLALKSSNDTISRLTTEKELFEQRIQQLEQENEVQRKEIDAARKEYNELKQIFDDERLQFQEKEKQLKDINLKFEQLQTMRSSHNSSFPPRPLSNKRNPAMEKLNLLREHSETSLIPFDDYLDENGGVVVADSDDSGGGSRTEQGENRSTTDSFTEISYPNVSEVQSQAHHSVSPIPPRTSSLGNTPVLDSTDDLFHFNEKYLLVKQLQEQILEMKNQLARSNGVIEELSHNLKVEKNEKNELKGKYEELLAYINRINRYQSTPPTPSNTAGMSPAMSNSNMSGFVDSSTGVGKAGSHDGSEKSMSANLQEKTINYEYLKNCIYKYMTSNSVSEKQRLFPVIGMILQFTNKELKQIEGLIQEEIQNDPTDQIQSAISTISSSIDYWFSSGTTNPHSTTTYRTGSRP